MLSMDCIKVEFVGLYSFHSSGIERYFSVRRNRCGRNSALHSLPSQLVSE